MTHLDQSFLKQAPVESEVNTGQGSAPVASSHIDASNGVRLPLQKRPALRVNPKYLLLFAKPKVGKTELAASLPNSLLLDFEGGSEMTSAVSLPINSYNELYNVAIAIRESLTETGKLPYKYIFFDTVTKMEEIGLPFAEYLYSNTPMGKYWFKRPPVKNNTNQPIDEQDALSGKEKYGVITNLPNGAGYPYLKQAFDQMLGWFENLSTYFILLGHLKDTMLTKDDKEFTSNEIDLTGKIKRTTSAKCDAIGYMYRRGRNKNYINFQGTDDVIVGARSPHLSNKNLLISEFNSAENLLTSHWDHIFLNEGIIPAPVKVEPTPVPTPAAQPETSATPQAEETPAANLPQAD